MNCNTPTDICFSFEGFRSRGGLTDVHRDGWGIAFFEGPGCRVFLDAQPSIDSPVAELVRRYPIHSMNVIAHIRKATQGVVALENTHPFMRELWGRYWIFAHNGNLLNFAPALDGSFMPVGNTDSERAFCFILQNLRQRFRQCPSHAELFAAMRELSTNIAAYGEFNFLLSNGDFLFAHCATKLSYIIRQAPFSVAHLTDQDISIDFSAVTTANDRVALIATAPLTDNEQWITLAPGSLAMFVHGALVDSGATAIAA
jgi:glutamine amidotransferase